MTTNSDETLSKLCRFESSATSSRKVITILITYGQIWPTIRYFFPLQEPPSAVETCASLHKQLIPLRFSGVTLKLRIRNPKGSRKITHSGAKLSLISSELVDRA